MINFITLLRIILLLPLAWVILMGGEHSWAAAMLFALGGITDWADGWLARRMHKTSTFGAMLDQICDKIFIVAVMVLIVAAGMLQNLMLVPVLLIIAREFAVAGLREYTAQQGRVIAVDKLGKIKTAVQFIALFLILIPQQEILGHVGALLLWLSAMLAWISAARYFHAIKLH
jgi:CDP-diacylglycerol--glycerol-3-phosphate 3-phosphatidyltransferase